MKNKKEIKSYYRYSNDNVIMNYNILYYLIKNRRLSFSNRNNWYYYIIEENKLYSRQICTQINYFKLIVFVILYNIEIYINKNTLDVIFLQ